MLKRHCQVAHSRSCDQWRFQHKKLGAQPLAKACGCVSVKSVGADPGIFQRGPNEGFGEGIPPLGFRECGGRSSPVAEVKCYITVHILTFSLIRKFRV